MTFVIFLPFYIHFIRCCISYIEGNHTKINATFTKCHQFPLSNKKFSGTFDKGIRIKPNYLRLIRSCFWGNREKIIESLIDGEIIIGFIRNILFLFLWTITIEHIHYNLGESTIFILVTKHCVEFRH